MVTAVELGSFTRAAQRLGLTQSGLTHMMNALEKETGFPLLVRDRSGVRLTVAGERLLPVVHEFLQSAGRLEEQIAAQSGHRRESIRVAAYSSVCMHWLPTIVQQFRWAWPDVSVDIRMGSVQEIYRWLQEGTVDLSFASRQDKERCDWVPLWDDPLLAILPPLPITSDYISAKMFLNDINTEMVPTQGTAIGAALEMAVNSFTPESDFRKAIVLITDGENFEDNAIEIAKLAADSGIEVDVIGIGSGKGAPIPLRKGSSEYMTDYNGNIVHTALNEEMARDIAKAGKGIYVSGTSSSAVGEIDSQLSQLAKTEYKRKAAVSAANELFPIAVLIALIFLVIDGVLSYSKIVWLRDINFFTKRTDNEKK